MAIKGCTWSATILRYGVVFEPCSVGIKGPCVQNQHRDTTQDRSVGSSFLSDPAICIWQQKWRSVRPDCAVWWTCAICSLCFPFLADWLESTGVACRCSTPCQLEPVWSFTSDFSQNCCTTGCFFVLFFVFCIIPCKLQRQPRWKSGYLQFQIPPPTIIPHSKSQITLLSEQQLNLFTMSAWQANTKDMVSVVVEYIQ